MPPEYPALIKQHENYFKDGIHTKGLKLEAAHTQKSNSTTSQVKTDSKFTLHNKKSTLTIEQNYKFSSKISTKIKLDPAKYTIETNLTSNTHPNSLGIFQLKTVKNHNNGPIFNLVASHKCFKNKISTTADFDGDILTGRCSLNEGKVNFSSKDLGLNLVHEVGKTCEESKNNLQVSAVFNRNIKDKNIMIGAKTHPFNLNKTEATGIFSTFTKQETKSPGKLYATEKLKTRILLKTDFRDKHLVSVFNQTNQHLSVMTALQYSQAKNHSLASLALIKTGKQGLNQHFRINSDGKVGYSHSLNVRQFKRYVKTCKVTIGGESGFREGKFEVPKLGLGVKFTV